MRLELAANPKGLDATAFKEYKKKEALKYLERKIANLRSQFDTLWKREEEEKENRQAAAALPAKSVLDRLLRYESKLEKQIRVAMEQLERLQRVRNRAVREPLTVEVDAETKPAGLLSEPINTGDKNSA